MQVTRLMKESRLIGNSNDFLLPAARTVAHTFVLGIYSDILCFERESFDRNLLLVLSVARSVTQTIVFGVYPGWLCFSREPSDLDLH